MPISRCPGQDSRHWRSDDVYDVPCPGCARTLEFWKDEPTRRCTGCGQKVVNPHLDLGCAKWCKFANECLALIGGSKTDESFCDALIREMKEIFADDRKRITHALEVLDYAEAILRSERADPLVVRASAVLHDIGIQEAERKQGSSARAQQETDGAPIARRILQKFEVSPERVEHICRIVGSPRSEGDEDSTESQIIWDADRLADIPDQCAAKDREQLADYVERTFRTAAGKRLAAERLASVEPAPTDDSAN